MLKWIDSIPLPLLLLAVLFLGGAPFVPEPHLFEKIRMVGQGTLTKPLDIFDLLYHASPLILLVVKISRLKQTKKE
jgi:hypothetical protein